MQYQTDPKLSDHHKCPISYLKKNPNYINLKKKSINYVLPISKQIDTNLGTSPRNYPNYPNQPNLLRKEIKNFKKRN